MDFGSLIKAACAVSRAVLVDLLVPPPERALFLLVVAVVDDIAVLGAAAAVDQANGPAIGLGLAGGHDGSE